MPNRRASIAAGIAVVTLSSLTFARKTDQGGGARSSVTSAALSHDLAGIWLMAPMRTTKIPLMAPSEPPQ